MDIKGHWPSVKHGLELRMSFINDVRSIHKPWMIRYPSEMTPSVCKSIIGILHIIIRLSTGDFRLAQCILVNYFLTLDQTPPPPPTVHIGDFPCTWLWFLLSVLHELPPYLEFFSFVVSVFGRNFWGKFQTLTVSLMYPHLFLTTISKPVQSLVRSRMTDVLL